MSKQFDVYLLPSDALSLVEGIRSRFGLRIWGEYSPTNEPAEISSPVRANSHWLKTTGSTSIACYVAPPDGRIQSFYCEQPNHWAIDSYSEAIEFSGCDFDGWTLIVGRFYFETAFVRNGEWVKKRAEFVRWADAVFRYAKRMLHSDKQLDAYVGKDAAEFRQTGGVFTRSIAQGPVHVKSTPARIARRTPSTLTIN
jgi:hypothetical protein